MIERDAAPGAIDFIDRRRIDQRKRAWKRGEGVSDLAGDSGETREVARAAVDRRPRLNLLEHRLDPGALDTVLLGAGEAAHCGRPSVTAVRTPHRRASV